METMSSKQEQRLHGEHELQMSKTEKSEQNDREIAVFLTKYGDLWLRERDLNPRPPGYEPDELPNCSTPRHTCTNGAKRIITYRLNIVNGSVLIFFTHRISNAHYLAIYINLTYNRIALENFHAIAAYLDHSGNGMK